MKRTWEITNKPDASVFKSRYTLEAATSKSYSCKCLICDEVFIVYDNCNMRAVLCPTCKQQVWVPRCPNGCPPFSKEERTITDAEYEMRESLNIMMEEKSK